MEDDWEVIDTITIINDLKRQFDASDIEQKKRYLVNIFENIQLILKDSSVILNEEKYLHFYNNYLKQDGIIWNMMKMFIVSDEKFFNKVSGLYTTINNAWKIKKKNEPLPVMPVPPKHMSLPVPPKGDPRDRIKKAGKSKKKIQIIKKSKKIKKLKKSMKKRKNMKTKTYKKH